MKTIFKILTSSINRPTSEGGGPLHDVHHPHADVGLLTRPVDDVAVDAVGGSVGDCDLQQRFVHRVEAVLGDVHLGRQIVTVRVDGGCSLHLFAALCILYRSCPK